MIWTLVPLVLYVVYMVLAGDVSSKDKTARTVYYVAMALTAILIWGTLIIRDAIEDQPISVVITQEVEE